MVDSNGVEWSDADLEAAVRENQRIRDEADGEFKSQLEGLGGGITTGGQPGLGDPNNWARPVGETVTYQGKKMVVTKNGLVPAWMTYAFIGGGVLLLALAVKK